MSLFYASLNHLGFGYNNSGFGYASCFIVAEL